MFENYTQAGSRYSQQFQKDFRQGDILSRIIGINIFIFFLITVSSIFFFLAGIKENPLVYLLSVPSSTEAFFQKPWGIFTYMFTHKGLFHLIFNMLWLYWMGRLFVKYFTEKRLLMLYIAGGIGGALLYMLAYNSLSVFAVENSQSYAIGASASVMAVFFAVAIYNPSYSILLLFLGRVKMLHLALAFVIIDLLLLPGNNSGGHISHLGGAFVGVLFALWMRRKLPSSFKGKAKSKAYRYKKDYTYNVERQEEEENINIILDKISKSGYESLTAAERKALFKSSYKK